MLMPGEKSFGTCHICGKLAHRTCSNCGKFACDSDFDMKLGICMACRRGRIGRAKER
jgi:hypothetical protein